MLFWIIAVVVFFLGTAVGSFLNVLVYRTDRHEDWIRGRSRCEHCKKPLAWYQNIPLFSYLFLKGKCARCHRPIDFIHPFTEFLTGSLFLWWFLAGSFVFTLSSHLQFVQPLFWLLIGVIFVVIFIHDWRYLVIPRWTVEFLTIATLFYRFGLIMTGEMRGQDFLWSVVWSLVITVLFFSLWWFTKGRGFGFGDVQLIFPLGLLLGGWQRIVIAVFFAFLTGALAGSALVVMRKKRLKQTIAFGPFLLLGTVISLLWGYELWAGYIGLLQGTAL